MRACGMAPCVLGALLASVTASAQDPRSRSEFGSRQDPGRLSDSFKRLEFEGVRFKFLALNDESCPIQIRSGRIVKTAVGKRALVVEVKSVLDVSADSFALGALVFDADGAFKADRAAGTGGVVPSRTSQSVEVPLERAALVGGDHVVLLVREVASSEQAAWRSDDDQVREAAREAVGIAAARKPR